MKWTCQAKHSVKSGHLVRVDMVCIALQERGKVVEVLTHCLAEYCASPAHVLCVGMLLWRAKQQIIRQ